jgi:hypothetical protein
MASAAFEIDPGTAVYGSSGDPADALQNVTVNCRLTSTSGVDTIEWEIFGTHGVADPTIALSGTPNGQIASFPTGLATTAANRHGQAYGIRCKVNGGSNQDNGDTQTSAVYVLGWNNIRPYFVGETLEDDSSYGSAQRIAKVTAGHVTSVATTGATYTVLAYDRIIQCDTSSTVVEVDLPAVAISSGRRLVIHDKSGNAAANNITIDGNGAETINGAATATISTNYGSRIIYCDGAAWYIVGSA